MQPVSSRDCEWSFTPRAVFSLHSRLKVTNDQEVDCRRPWTGGLVRKKTLSVGNSFKPLRHAVRFVSAIAIVGCTSGTEPEATLAIATPPDFSATVSQVQFESANGPAGPYSQYDIWVAIPPSSTANAGVVVSTSRPIFERSKSGRVTVARGSDIKVGSTIEVWHLGGPGYGAVQGPPGAPTYGGDQIVIVR